MKTLALLIGVTFHAGLSVDMALGQASLSQSDEFNAIRIPGEIPAYLKVNVNSADSGPRSFQQDPKTLLGSISQSAVATAPSEHRKFLETPSTYASARKDGVLKMDVGKESSQRHELELLAATYREVATPTNMDDCRPLSLSVGLQIKSNPATILEIVAAEIGANPSCSCEIVKTAITTIESSPDQVANIVEAAITASPENMRLISQCAIASSPESLAAVQAVIAKLDPNSGDSSTTLRKSAKSAKSAKAIVESTSSSMPNPLDLPYYIAIPPPLIAPPSLSNVNP